MATFFLLFRQVCKLDMLGKTSCVDQKDGGMIVLLTKEYEA